MTRITVSGNNDQTEEILVTNREAQRLLKLIQSTNTFMVNGTDFSYIESSIIISGSQGNYNELLIIAEVMR